MDRTVSVPNSSQNSEEAPVPELINSELIETESGQQNPWLKSLENWYDIDSYKDQGRISAGTLPHSKNVTRKIQALKKLLYQNKKIETQFYKELHALEAKYNALQTPLYDSRASLIKGGEKGEENLESEECVPDFWKTVILNAPLLKDVVEAYDHDILKYLEDIRVMFTDNGYKLHFFFADNPYFTNSVLFVKRKKRFEKLHYDNSTFGSSSKIDWKPGKNVTMVKITRKKKKCKKQSEHWLVRPSFFDLFANDGGMCIFLHPIQIVDYIKDRIVTRAIYYFSGECVESPFEQFFEEKLSYFLENFLPND